MQYMASAAVATPENTQTFADFRKEFDNPGSAVADVEVTDPTDTGTKPPAGDGANPNPKTAPASEPENKEQGRFEKRVNEKQRRIDELTKQENEAKKRVEALLAQLPAEKTEAPKTPATASAAFDGTDANDPRPKFPSQTDQKYAGSDGWDLYEQDKAEYAAALAEWNIRKRQRTSAHEANIEQQKKATEANQKLHKEALDVFEDRGAEFAEEHDDYPELVAQFKTQMVSNETAAVIVNADNGPAILHHLMQNPEEMKRIEALPTAIARLDAVYELKYKLKAPAEPKADPAPKKRSAAPAAGSPLRGGGGSAPITMDNATSYSAFKKAFDHR